MKSFRIILIVSGLFACSQISSQTWTGNGIPVVTIVNGAQDQIVLCATKVHDGIIYAWRDSRSVAISQDIYAQKLTPCGTVAPGWPAGGLVVCNATSNQQYPQIVPDGSDGAFITWQDTRGADWDIYMQHITGAGAIAGGWPANGLDLCVLAGIQQNPHICIDGSGGAIVSWDDQRSGNWDVWASRVTSGGTKLWGATGTLVITQSSTQNFNAIAPDSVGGAYFAWEDSRTGSASIDIWGMHLNAAGASVGGLWSNTSTGLLLSNLTTSQKYPGIVNTGSNSVIFFWADPNGAGENIKATKYTSAGAIYTPGVWVQNGVVVGLAITQSGNPGTATYPVGAADCSGGAYIAYQSNYSSSDHDVLTIHVGGDGNPASGLETTAFNTDIEKNDVITPDGIGGAFNAWQDQWPPAIVWYRRYSGAAVLASGVQSGACDNPNITAMGGVAYVAWEDARTGNLGGDDIYAISSSALAPPPILNSTITYNWSNYSCAVTSLSRTICFGTSVTFTVPLPAGLFNSYTFKDGATTLQTSASNIFTTSALTVGTHTITATSSTAGGCVTAPSNSIIITVSAGPTVSLASQTNVLCNGNSTGAASVSASGGNPTYTYAWSPSGGSASSATNLTSGSYTCTVTDAIGCVSTQSVTITQSSAITGVVSSVPATCGNTNGTASIVAGGGTPGYTYSWSPAGGTGSTTTALAAGNYTCTITDAASCTRTFVATINNTGAPTVTLSTQSNISCNGGSNGSATMSASGGTGPYTYSWSPSGGTAATATGLTAGTYTCAVIDANGCVQSQTVTITQPSVLGATISGTNINCNSGTNGSATVIASGGTTSYTYNWNPSGGTAATASTLSANNYTCTITDANGCTTTQSVAITAPSALNVTSSSTNISCNGGSNGSANVSISGGTPSYTYSWSPSGGTSSTASSLSNGNYTCTITDANSCITTQSFAITQPLALSVTSSSTNEICGNANGTASVVPSGGVGPYNFSWNSGGSASTESALPAGSYTCIITDANGCGLTATVSVGSTSGPTVSVASQTPASCNAGNNGTATLTVNGGTPAYTFAWAPVGGTTITGTGLSAGSYTCTVTDANGCIQTQTVTITEPNAITATSSSVNASCGNTNGSATVAPSGGTGAFTFSWAPSGGTGSTTTPVGAGNYTCTITDANGCIGTAVVPVNNIGGPTVILSSQSDVTCNGGTNGTATVSASGGNPGYTYFWSPSGGTGVIGIGLSATTYSCTVTDASGCIQTLTVLITEPPALTTTSTSTAATCGNNNGTATVTPTGGTGAYTYNWSPSGGSAGTAINLGAATYSCLITDANGCSITETVSILNTGSPTLTLSSQVNVSCFNGSNGQAVMNASGGTPAYSYVWSSGGTAATETGLVAGTYTCTVTDANGCVQAETVSITSPLVISSTTTPTDATCNNNNGSALITVSGGTVPYTYNWSSGGGTSTEINLGAGTYTCIVTDANGCSHIDSAQINSTPAPSLTLSAQTNVLCNGNSTGTATMNASGGTPGYSYSWSSGGTAATESNLAVGTYTCTVTDATGCTQTETVTITEPSAISINVIPTNVMCFGATNGSANATVTGGTSSYSYSWSSGGTSATENNLAQGTYTLTVTDANGCVSTQITTITEPTGITASSVSTPACGNNNGNATITATGGSGAFTYNWTPSGGTANTVSGLANGTYTCTITDANGCSITSSVAVTSNANPTAVVSAPVTITLGSSTQLTSSGGTTYLWTPTTALNCNTCSNPIASPSSTTAYCVQVTDNNGCSDTACTNVIVDTECGDIFIPNAYSPNGDSQNDQLCLYGVQCLSTFVFTIYDRWGEKVFETMNASECWDGTYKGQILNSGVFVYKLTGTKANGDAVERKGNITLVR